MELFRDNETNNSNGTQQRSESSLVGGKPIGYFTSLAEDLNLGLPRTNPASGQYRTGTWDLWIKSPVPQLLCQAASFNMNHSDSTLLR